VEIQEARPSFVRFERIAKEDKARSAAAGYYVGKDIDIALVTPAGSRDVFKQEVGPWLEQLDRDVAGERLPAKWRDHYKQSYEAWKRGEEVPLDGTPIKGWLRISPAQAETLISIGVRTVEDLAALNDEGLKRVGMGGVDLKNIAVAELQAAKDIGPVVRENAALKQKVSGLEASLSSLQAQVQVLMSTIGKPEEITASDVLPDDLVAQYTEKFKKPPHHRMKRETIEAALRE
jgi:hypothetical protein